MNLRDLIVDLYHYFEEKEDRTHDEDLLLNQLIEQQEYFPITSLHRDDLDSLGFDSRDVYDVDMAIIADKMGDAYQENGYWIDLDIIAEDKVPKHKCPKCNSDAREYFNGNCSCRKCSNEWEIKEPTGQYVSVTGKKAQFFVDNKIGFDNFASGEMVARYIPEHTYIDHFDKEPKPKDIFIPIGYPASQKYLDWEKTAPTKFAKCDYISPSDTVLDLGVDALFVPKRFVKK